MISTPHYHRALLLHSQGRYADAKNELHQALMTEPTNPQVHALLGVCLVHLEDYTGAAMEARNAINLAPTMAWGHYAMAFVAYRRNRLDEALTAVAEAIRLEPDNADYYALLAQLRFEQRKWPSALEAAEQGLMHDPEHVQCNNVRAMALVKLGRHDEAGATIDATLRRSPEDADSHANQGWTFLHAREPKRALEHFREALRLEPNHQWARAGIVEALKARFFLYRWLLAYFLWMGRQSGRAQWGILIGGYVAYRFLLDLAQKNPAAGKYLWPLLYAYIAFAILTWLSYPMFNLLLRLSRFGRLVLTRKQVIESNCIGALLAAAVICGVFAWRAGEMNTEGWGVLAVVCFLMVVPTKIAFHSHAGWPRWTSIGVAAGLSLIGLFAAACCFTYPRLEPYQQIKFSHLASDTVDVFLYGSLAWMIGANWIMSVKVRR
jgi:tetratricopeptide (TPR) repeat protein